MLQPRRNEPTAVTPLPENLVQPLAGIRDTLQNVVEAVALPAELARASASAGALVPLLTAAGCVEQANYLASSIRYMDSATVLWAEHCAAPTPASSRKYDDEVFQAFDLACWAIEWEDPENHKPLPAGIVSIDLGVESPMKPARAVAA